MNNNELSQEKKEDYRTSITEIGKKEFTLLKMQEYGFWPKDWPTPYEKQLSETQEDYKRRKELLNSYQKIADKISKLYEQKYEIITKLHELKKKYDETWDYERIRLDVAQSIMQESIKRRAEKKEQKEIEKRERSEAWKKEKKENIVFIGKDYSALLNHKKNNEARLTDAGLPLIKDDKELAVILGLEYKELRFLVYDRDVVMIDHYYQYTIPKKNGGIRNIAAPKSTLKHAQRKILERILEKIPVSNNAHGFLKGKSVVSGAETHITQPSLLINMDIENFFPTITFERVRGMFISFGYSGYIASMLAMLCTYCERMPIKVRGIVKHVKISDRILPQGSPASPMITNIICSKLDKRLNGLATKCGFIYTRYADDMSFSCMEDRKFTSFISSVSKILSEEGFKVNEKKTRFLRKNNRQSITGIVVNNEQIGVPKKWVKKLRAIIYNASNLKKSGELPFESRYQILGMISWLNCVNAERYERIIGDALKVLNN